MAGLAELLLGKSNPFAQFVNENQNKVHAAFGGLGSGTNFNEGLSAAAQAASRAAPLDQLAAQERDTRNKTAAYLRSQPGGAQFADAIENGMVDGSTAFKSWMDASRGPEPTANMRDWQFAQENPGYAEFLNSDGGGDISTGFTPVWGTYEGQAAIALPGNDGRLYIDGKPIDATKFVPTNPYDLNAQKAGGTALGKLTGGAQFNVPNAQEEMDQSLAATAKLGEADVKAGMEDWFKQWGMFPRGVWVQGGSNMANFRNTANNIIDRSWLSAREALKGGGQITDYEGQKAENAVSMMKTALESGDKSSYEQAVRDYEYWIQRGFEKLLQQAGSLPGGFGAPQQGGNIPTVVDQAGYEALPSGSQYVAPDGTTRTKP